MKTLADAARALLTCSDFWANAKGVPGEYDDLKEALAAHDAATAPEDEKLLALARKATPGPWRFYRAKLRPQFDGLITEVQKQDGTPIIPWSGFDDSSLKNRHHDARYIAAANPSAIIALIERHCAEKAAAVAARLAEAARAQNNRLRGDPLTQIGTQDLCDLLAGFRLAAPQQGDDADEEAKLNAVDDRLREERLYESGGKP